MRKTTMHNSKAHLEVHELTDDELDVVTGGSKSGGTAGGNVVAGWDIKANKRV